MMNLYIRYMVSQRCRMLVEDELRQLGIAYTVVELGRVELPVPIAAAARTALRKNLLALGLELLDDRKAILIERITGVVLEMIALPPEELHTNYSDYISAKLAYNYTYLSNVFSEVKGMTLQQFIIVQKIECVKELLLYDELNLSEIARKLHYSSAAHLSNQFRKITGLSPSFFRQLRQQRMHYREKL